MTMFCLFNYETDETMIVETNGDIQYKMYKHGKLKKEEKLSLCDSIFLATMKSLGFRDVT